MSDDTRGTPPSAPTPEPGGAREIQLDAWAKRLAHYWPDSISLVDPIDKVQRFPERIKFYRSELEQFGEAYHLAKTQELRAEIERLKQELADSETVCDFANELVGKYTADAETAEAKNKELREKLAVKALEKR
jgi:uncharacterized membrane-anchored protein YjiN (DUF445 family)